MAKEGAYITARQIEAARIAMNRYMKSFKRGKLFINIFRAVSNGNGTTLPKYKSALEYIVSNS